MIRLRAWPIGALLATLFLGAAVSAAPATATYEVVATDFEYDIEVMTAEPGEEVVIKMENGGNALHDIVFELEDDRVEASERINPGEATQLEFTAPETPGEYVFYCSVGRHRQLGMEGTFIVGDVPSATDTPTAEATSEPVPYDTAIGNLNIPRGISVDADGVVLIGEAGTGDPVPGAFSPGNDDGRVLRVPLDDPDDREVVVDELTNSFDPGGGLIGANHAVRWTTAEDEDVVLVAVAGGPGAFHADPPENAKILMVHADGEVEQIADLIIEEAQHNPGGEDPADNGLDQNPWRLTAHGEYVYIADAGANAVWRLDPASREVVPYAAFAPVDDEGEVQPVPTDIVFDPDAPGVAYVSLLGSVLPNEGQIRRLEDLDGDGLATGEDENTLLVDELFMPTDLAYSPSGALYVIEMGRALLSRVDTDAGSTTAVADQLIAASGMDFTAAGDLLVSVWGHLLAEGERMPNTDRLVRLPADSIGEGAAPTATATPSDGTAMPPTPTEPAPTATPTSMPEPTDEPGGAQIYLPTTLKVYP